MSPWCVLLFFMPFVNLLFFLLMSALPSREAAPREERRSFLDRLIPRDPVGSAAMAVGIVVPLSALLVLLAVAGLGSYGWGVFLGLPFALGLTASLLHGYHQPRGFGSCVVVSFVALGVLGLLLVAVAAEGMICIAMASPILAVLTLVGAAVGYAIQGPVGRARQAPPAAGLLVIALPLLMGAERACPPEERILEVTTSVEIDAPPERVWGHVVEFSELPPPEEWLFRRGIAYPVRARIDGRGAGAVRHCVFSTGAFVEPIEVWDEPRLLKFSVASSPPAMEEWTLWAGPRPPHVEDYLVSKAGQFRLEPLAGGRTRLEGTTWYTHRIWPEGYWRLWSDGIIGKIHGRVLRHIKSLAEAEKGKGKREEGKGQEGK
jgi:hypothetical protein